jgi:hypothetical protein
MNKFKILSFEIPEISDERLEKLTARIRPIVAIDDEYHFIEPVDPRGVSFIWDPKPTEKASGLTQIAVIPTLHSYGYYGIFKPSIAEVLAMIPHTIIDVVVAFEVDGPDTSADLNAQGSIVDGGYHLAQTTLYGARVSVQRRIAVAEDPVREAARKLSDRFANDDNTVVANIKPLREALAKPVPSSLTGDERSVLLYALNPIGTPKPNIDDMQKTVKSAREKLS